MSRICCSKSIASRSENRTRVLGVFFFIIMAFSAFNTFAASKKAKASASQTQTSPNPNSPSQNSQTLDSSTPIPASSPAPTQWSQGISQEDKSRATVLYNEGSALIRDGAYLAAAEKLTEAARIWDNPLIHFNLILALKTLSQPIESYEHLISALKYGQAPFTQEQYEYILKRKLELEQQIGRINVSCQTEAAKVIFDGKELSVGPNSKEIWVRAGEHIFIVSREGYVTRTMTIKAQGAEPVDVRLVIERENVPMPMGAGEIIFSPLGFLQFGPILEIGPRLGKSTFLDAHVRWSYAGLLYQVIDTDGFDSTSKLNSFGVGLRLSHFFGNGRHRPYITGVGEITWGGQYKSSWDRDWKGFTAMAGGGYRWRYSSGFFLQLGALAGFHDQYKAVYKDSLTTDPEGARVIGMFELSIGSEFGIRSQATERI